MRISAVVAELMDDLGALGALGDEETAGTARRLAAAMQRPLSSRLLEALGQVAAELDAKLADGHAELRLAGDDAEIVLVEAPHDVEGHEPVPDGDSEARITLRLPSSLKSRVEQASARDAVSVNTWIVRALALQVRGDRGPRTGRRLTGYGRS